MSGAGTGSDGHCGAGHDERGGRERPALLFPRPQQDLLALRDTIGLLPQ